MLGSLKREVFKRGKILGCSVLLLKGCMAKPPKTSRTVFLSPVEQSLAVHIPKWRWLLSTDTFRRAAALEVGPQASSACYMQTDSRGLCGCQGPPLAVRGRWSSAACCSASQPQSLFGGCGFKRAPQQMLYVITSLFL